MCRDCGQEGIRIIRVIYGIRQSAEGKGVMDGSVETLIVAFIVVSVSSIFALVLMFVVKEPRAKTMIFYALAIWGILLAWQHVLTLETKEIAKQLGAWGFGGLSVAAMLVDMFAKGKSRFWISRLLVLFSVIFGILGAFSFEIVIL